jgi:hypothetical protein
MPSPTAFDVGPIVAEIDAPVDLVFQMLAAIGQGPVRPGESAEVLRRNGDELVCNFVTTVRLPLGRARQVRTLEAVRLAPPDRIEYEHLDGPVRGLRESIVMESLGPRRTRLVYRGTYRPTGPLAGHAFRLVSRSVIERAVADHFDELRDRAERRAGRSRLFGPAPADTVEPTVAGDAGTWGAGA